jgi:Tfp pilus assembly protein PilZ
LPSWHAYGIIFANLAGGRNTVSDTPREYPRFEVKAYVDYAGTDVLLYHGIQNVSLGGICIHNPSVEAVGTIVNVVVNFPDLGKQLALTGEVVWANHEEPQDMGIRWIDLTDADRGALKEYLDKVQTRVATGS